MDMNEFNSNDQCGAISENMEPDSVSSFGFHFIRVGHSPKGQPGKVFWMPGTRQWLSGQQATGVHSFLLEMGTK